VSTLLVVDIGNTTTRVGLWRDGTAREMTVLPTRSIPDTPGDTAKLDAIAELVGLDGLKVAISSVVPEVGLIWVRWCQERGAPFMVIRGDTPAPVVNRYSQPERLGPDRLANAVGAVRRFGAPAIIAALGTATVVDAVSPRREFLGGAIVAGVQAGVSALAEMTAALPCVELPGPLPQIGQDTDGCMRLGAVVGAAAMVEGLAARFRALAGEVAPLALTGGNAQLVSEHLRMPHHVFPSLTLEGIGAIWEHNQGRG